MPSYGKQDYSVRRTGGAEASLAEEFITAERDRKGETGGKEMRRQSNRFGQRLNNLERVGRWIALPGLVALLLIPATAHTQDPPPGGDNGKSPASGSGNIGDKLVVVDAENQRLVDVLPALMKQVGADYSLDSEIKNVTVSLHLPSAKFQAALDTLMKVASQPVTYKIEDGLYHFMRRTDTSGSQPTAPPSTSASTESTGRIPPYRGDDQLGVMLSDLFQYLGGTDLNFEDPRSRQGRSLLAGSSSMSGSRNYSSYGFVNGQFTSSSYTDPDIGNPNSSVHTSGGGFNFGPISVRNSSTTRGN